MELQNAAAVIGAILAFIISPMVWVIFGDKPDFREKSLDLLVRTKTTQASTRLRVFLEHKRSYRGQDHTLLGRNEDVLNLVYKRRFYFYSTIWVSFFTSSVVLVMLCTRILELESAANVNDFFYDTAREGEAQNIAVSVVVSAIFLLLYYLSIVLSYAAKTNLKQELSRLR